MKGLFDDIEIPETPNRDTRGRLPTKKKGHYASPGTGPAGETCGTCRHIIRIKLASKAVARNQASQSFQKPIEIYAPSIQPRLPFTEQDEEMDEFDEE